MMQRPFRCAATLALLIGAALSAGCGSGEGGAVVEKRDVSQMRVVGILYGRCMQANGGAAPANEEKFAAFMQQEPENWNKLAPTPKELLTSPRDGQPLVVVYGRRLKDDPEIGFPLIAHEKTGVDGQQMVISTNGTVQLKSPDEVAQLFPSS
jgi:hypothetical protein